jgi:hypothetical protein
MTEFETKNKVIPNDNVVMFMGIANPYVESLFYIW